MIERGDFLPREKDNWRAVAVFGQHRYHNAEPWIDREGTPFRPVTGYHVRGNTKLYGAAVLRRRESDFGSVQRRAQAEERRRLSDLRARGVIGDDAFHRVEEELDWD